MLRRMQPQLERTSLRDRTREDIYALIRASDSLTRSDLVDITGLPNSTVGHAIERLLGDGRIVRARAETKGPGSGSGRPGFIYQAVARGNGVLQFDARTIAQHVAAQFHHPAGHIVRRLCPHTLPATGGRPQACGLQQVAPQQRRAVSRLRQAKRRGSEGHRPHFACPAVRAAQDNPERQAQSRPKHTAASMHAGSRAFLPRTKPHPSFICVGIPVK